MVISRIIAELPEDFGAAMGERPAARATIGPLLPVRPPELNTPADI